MGKKPEELQGRGWGLGERQAEQGVPSNQSLKMLTPPPITVTLLFGWAFLSFPLREVGTGAQPRQYPAGPSCNSQNQRTKENCWGDKGALCACCGASMAFCLSSMLSCLTPTLVFRGGPGEGTGGCDGHPRKVGRVAAWRRAWRGKGPSWDTGCSRTTDANDK